MIAQVDKCILSKLTREVKRSGIRNFTAKTLARLKKEQPHYAAMLRHLAGDRGEEHERVVSQVGTLCFRALELADDTRGPPDIELALSALTLSDNVMDKMMGGPPKR